MAASRPIRTETVVTWLGVKPAARAQRAMYFEYGLTKKVVKKPSLPLTAESSSTRSSSTRCDVALGLGGGVRGQRARPEQLADVAAAERRSVAHQADEQQRGGVVRRRGEPVAQARLVLVREHDDLGLVRLVLDGSSASSKSATSSSVGGGARQRRAATSAPCARAPAATTRAARRRAARARAATRASVGEVARRHLERAEEGGGRPVDGVVRRAGADQAAAARADAEHHRPRAAAGEDAGGHARVGQQAGERLAVGDHVAVHDDEAAAPRRRPARRSPRGRRPARGVARTSAASPSARTSASHAGRVRTIGARHAERGELVDEPAEQRAVVPRQQRRRPALGGAARSRAARRRRRTSRRGRRAALLRGAARPRVCHSTRSSRPSEPSDPSSASQRGPIASIA